MIDLREHIAVCLMWYVIGQDDARGSEKKRCEGECDSLHNNVWLPFKGSPRTRPTVQQHRWYKSMYIYKTKEELTSMKLGSNKKEKSVATRYSL
jgi:hypothetical protein